MAKLRSTGTADGQDPISREAARLQHIDAELRELEDALVAAHGRSVMGGSSGVEGSGNGY